MKGNCGDIQWRDTSAIIGLVLRDVSTESKEATIL